MNRKTRNIEAKDQNDSRFLVVGLGDCSHYDDPERMDTFDRMGARFVTSLNQQMSNVSDENLGFDSSLILHRGELTTHQEYDIITLLFPDSEETAVDNIRAIMNHVQVKPDRLILVLDDIMIPWGAVEYSKGKRIFHPDVRHKLDNMMGSDYWRIKFGTKNLGDYGSYASMGDVHCKLADTRIESVIKNLGGWISKTVKSS